MYMQHALQVHELRVSKILNLVLPSVFFIFGILVALLLDAGGATGGIFFIGAVITFSCRFLTNTRTRYKVKFIHSFVVCAILIALMVTMGAGNRSIPVAFFVMMYLVTLFYSVKLILFYLATTVLGNLIVGGIFSDIYTINYPPSGWLFLALLFLVATTFAVIIAHFARDLVIVSEQKRVEAETVSEESSNLRQEISQLIKESFHAGDNLSLSSREISQAIDALVSVIQSTAENTGKVSNNADRISAEAADMDKITANALTSVQVATSSMDTIRSSSNTSLELMEKLNKASKEISVIVDLISDVADKTNLLALNAALEAARAGEHGKGFAVVSDEIRSLAEQTKLSTADVLKIVEGLVQQTSSLKEALNINNHEVSHGYDAVGTTAEALSQLSDKVSTVSGEINEVSLAIQDLSSGSEEMAASSEQQVAQLKQMSASIEDLAIKLDKIFGLVTKEVSSST